MTNDKPIIRTTTLSDLSDINKILNNVIESSDSYLTNKLKTIDDTRRWFDEHQNSDYYTILSTVINEQVVGWVCLSPFRNIDGYNITAELSVYVDPAFHRRGIAQQMMLAIENFALAQKKLHTIISLITANNKASINLHEKMGYTIAGTLKEVAVKNNKLADVVLMAKHLDTKQTVI